MHGAEVFVKARVGDSLQRTEARELCVCKWAPTGRSDKAFCSSSDSASKAAVKPQRMKRMSPPSGERVTPKSAMRDCRWESGMEVEVSGKRGMSFWEHQ